MKMGHCVQEALGVDDMVELIQEIVSQPSSMERALLFKAPIYRIIYWTLYFPTGMHDRNDCLSLQLYNSLIATCVAACAWRSCFVKRASRSVSYNSCRSVFLNVPSMPKYYASYPISSLSCGSAPFTMSSQISAKVYFVLRCFEVVSAWLSDAC